MKDFEKLGLFYLGRELDPETKARRDVPVLYDASDLVTHAVIAGMTGSGKTGLGIGIIEEAAIDGVPVIAIDPKGDLGNLLLTFPKLTGAEFAPWVNPDEARRAGQSPEAFGEAEAKRWAAGLAEWGQDGARIARLRDAAEFALYTPGSSSGRPLSIVKSFAAPDPEVANDDELLSDRVSTAATSVLALAGVTAEPLESREHILLSTLFTDAWRKGLDLDLEGLIAQVQKPPVARVGVLDLESFYPAKDRFALAMQLNRLLAAPGFAAWLQGEPLEIDKLLYGVNGRPRVSVISLAHLDDHERMFFVSLLLNEIVSWMRAQRGTASLRALVYFDEIVGFLPPVANPPSKAPLLRLLKQARAFGLGLTVATQNPVDLDYRPWPTPARGCSAAADRARRRAYSTAEGVVGVRRHVRSRGIVGCCRPDKRVFLLHNVHDRNRRCSKRGGPSHRAAPRAGRNRAVPPSPAAQSAVRQVVQVRQVPQVREGSAAPVLDPAIPQFFAPGSGDALAPVLAGCARIVYTDAKIGLDESRDVCVVTPITDDAVAVDWDRAEPAGFKTADLQKVPARFDVSFAPLPAAATQAKNYGAWEKDFARWAAQSQAVELFRSRRTKLVSTPDEAERDFRIRVNAAAREGRDAALQKVRDKSAARLATLQDRVRRAEQSVQVQSEQATGAKVSAAVSIGATIFGALLGRKAVNAGTLGRATTAARGWDRSAASRGRRAPPRM